MERNPLRASLVAHAEQWRWGGLWRRHSGVADDILSPWPVGMPRDWLKWVNQPLTDKELEAIRRSMARGQPYGGPIWTKQMATRLGLSSTLRPRGRPRKGGKGQKEP